MKFEGKYEKMMQKVHFPTWTETETKFDGQIVIITTDGQQIKVINDVKWIKTMIFLFDRFISARPGRYERGWSGWAQGMVWTGRNSITVVVEPKWF